MHPRRLASLAIEGARASAVHVLDYAPASAEIVSLAMENDAMTDSL